MTEPRKPEQGGGGVGAEVEEPPKPEPEPKQSKTLQELERLQFAELERER